AKRALLEIVYFSGLGALIIFLGAAALARMSVRTARDLEYQLANEPVAAPGADTSAAYAAPAAAPAVAPDAPTDAAPRAHRRERSGLFRRRRHTATSH
ncbi:MAG: hypothetical protein WBF82_08525, partial [Mycobacterium sp.]